MDILNIANTAELLGISTTTVRNWVKSQYLPAYSKNNKYFFYKDDIKAIKLKLLNGKLEKLKNRANKITAQRTFIPEEYVQNPVVLNAFNHVISFIQKNNIQPTIALFLLSLNWLKKEKVLLKINIQDIIKGKKIFFTNKQIQKEINLWLLEINKQDIKPFFTFLLDCKLPIQKDVLGVFYQSLLFEGDKSHSGSYYTPSSIVDNITKDVVKKDSKVLDPCCGTGQFLLSFADIVENPLNIYGIDCDKIAVKIARLNILTRFKNQNFVPNIFCKNTLFDIDSNSLFDVYNDTSIKNFNVISTNPPWGVHFSKAQMQTLANLYPQITSFESFSYFIKKSLSLLCHSGVMVFILPESILNVRIHKDIRQIILKNAQIKKIVYLNRVFKNVFTPAIRLDLEKNNKQTKQTIIYNKNKKYKIPQIKWMSNHDFIFDIHANKWDLKIIDKVYQTQHTTLENKATWALGIVTGNNKKFLTTKKLPYFEPIYKGKDIKKMILDKPACYIRFQPEKFQQVASEKLYRAKEKLIYKFISKNLVFAYDNCKRLTLNSANILIPKIDYYPIKVIAGLFNSSLYQFLFQKKFSTIKVLRSHIETLPLPLWDKKTFTKIVRLVDQVIQNKKSFQVLDDYIISKFSFSEKQKTYIKTEIK